MTKREVGAIGGRALPIDLRVFFISIFVRGQPVNRELACRFDQLRRAREMLREFVVVIQPPKCARDENEMRRAAPAQLLKIDNQLFAVAGIAVVNAVPLEEMPAFTFRVIKNCGITIIGRDN